MIADYKPYSTMKNSEIPWLGDVPGHWDVRRIKTLFREKDVRCGDGRGVLLSLTRVRGIVPQAEASKRIASAEDLSKYKVCRPGDLVMNRMQAWSGMFALSSYEGVVSPDYSVFAAIGASEVKYFEQLFKTPLLVDQFAQRSKGIGSGFNRLYTPDFGAVHAVVPPLSEQAAIVRFLDHADRRIRHYIRTKQKLIKLLEEKKQAIIHRTVACGLDPNVRLKPSGVEWLGDVPAHWEVLPIKRAFISMDYGISESSIDGGTIRLLTMGNIRSGKVTIPESGGVLAVDPSLLLHPGDLLFNRTNSADLVGKVGLFTGADVHVTFASYLVRMRPRPTHQPEYLNAVLNDVSVLSVARREAIPSLHQSNLNPTRYGRLNVSLPPLEEQAVILRYLKSKTSDLETAIEAAHDEISLCYEYRARLIADVVTGKLDVRDAADRLPDEAKDLEPIDDADLTTDAETETADELDAVPEEAEA